MNIKDDRGNLSLIAAVCFSVFGLLVGMAIDLQHRASVKRNVENALDAVVLMAARDGATESESQPFFNAQLGGSAKTLSLDLDLQVRDGITHGRVTGQLPTLFSGLIGISQMPIAAEAGATGAAGASNCVLALAPDKYGISLNSNSVIEANCGAHSNSRSSESIYANSRSFLRAAAVSTSGRVRVNSGSAISPTAVLNAPSVADPLASLPAPGQSTAPCRYNNVKVVSGVRTLEPGVYCGGIIVENGAEVRFNAGVYIIRNGEMKVNSGSKISGSAVMFYFMGDKGRTDFNSGARVDLAAQNTGPFKGILFFQARNRPNDQMIINSDGQLILVGIIYNPSSELMWNSASSGEMVMAIISYRIIGNSHLSLRINNPANASSDIFHPLLGSMYNSGQSGSEVRLVY